MKTLRYFYNASSLQSCGIEKAVACCIAAAIKEQCSTSKTEELIYGLYSLDEWNNLSEDEQIAIQDRYEYNLQHEDQKEWFID